ncbi:hypothetical protein TPY_2831 [Sulfobacillus acidophilus TPY]|nr:hypothetical protein TPY_2831 [Sulfobacillus acidophilus TPY]
MGSGGMAASTSQPVMPQWRQAVGAFARTISRALHLSSSPTKGN